MDQSTPYRRRSLRLRDYDYAQAGAYFVTVCAQNRTFLFGDVVEEDVRRNASGDMVLHWWMELLSKYPHIEIDEVIVMPNHLHGIILINDLSAGPEPEVSEAQLGAMIGWFKTMATNAYIRGVREAEWQPFHRRLWQPNYFEHIIRSERTHDRIRAYIAANPSRWPFDEENPERSRSV